MPGPTSAAQLHAGRAVVAALARSRHAGADAPRGVARGAWLAPAALEPPGQHRRCAVPRRAPWRCAAAPSPEALELIKKDLSRRRDGPPLPPRRKAAPTPDVAPQPARQKRVVPPPDPRTVAFLVERGVGTTAVVTALLSRNERGATRGSHANAEAAWAFLHQVLAECAAEAAAEAAGGGAGGAAAPPPAVVEVDALPPPPRRKGRPRKGEGEPFTAAGAVREAPQLLYCGIDRLRRGWAFLRAPVAAGGAGYSREDALVALFRFGRWVEHTPSAIAARAAFLEREFGFSDGMRVTLQVPALLHFSDETLRTKAAALQVEGLDAPRLLEAAPRLASISAASLRQKAAWLRDVAGLSAEEVNAAPALLAYSLPGRVRPRYFFAARLRALDGRALMTFCYPADDEFLANTLRHTAAATWSPEQYRRHIASKEFNDWADAREAELQRQNRSASGTQPDNH